MSSIQPGQFQEYLKSVVLELQASKNRIRLLIGNRHWQTDGEHKEAILRKSIGSFIPGKLSLLTGFMVNEIGLTSGQIDVLIVDRLEKPILFQYGDLAVVTPDCAKAIIEVKTRIRNQSELTRILKKLSDHLEFQRTHSDFKAFGGLFVYEDSAITDEQVRESLHEAASKNLTRTINWIAIGSNKFYRFWQNGLQPISPPHGESFWHSYYLQELAQAYFISNVIWDVSEQAKGPLSVERTEHIWFPIPEGKESRRTGYIGLLDRNAVPAYWNDGSRP